MVGFFKAFKQSIAFSKASKYFNAGKYERAVQVLKATKFNDEYSAKAILLEADTRYKMREYEDAIELYRDFLERHSEKIARLEDRKYLILYAQYYAQTLHKRMGIEKDVDRITRLRLEEEARSASWLTRSEFVA